MGGAGGVNTEQKSLLSVIAHAIDPGSFRGLPQSPPSFPPPHSRGRAGWGLGGRLKSGWTLPVAEAPLSSEGPAPASVTAEFGPVFDWAKRGIRCSGIVEHRYLMRLCREGVDKWGAARLIGEKANIRKLLIQAGLNRDEASKMADAVL
ncbi:MAG: hypothetical protein AAB356_06585, partial [Deltaproteobacteria bacterium]